MLTIGNRFPQYALKSVADTSGNFPTLSPDSHSGKWRIFVFWPKDFTFVCPTEIIGFGDLAGDFRDRDAELIGVSTDTEFVHLAWRKSREDLSAVKYPWLADVKKELTAACGVLDADEGVAQRATFIVDPNNVVQFAEVTAMNVGRNPQEVLRILDALQTDELCPCNWTPGQETIKAA